jgi:hypothetical protein
MIGMHTLDQGVPQKLFTQAVEGAHARVLAAEARVAAAAAPGS